jgi:cytoskeletal protein CcmA (bactofilin family)
MATAISVLDSNQPDSEQASIIGTRVCIQGTILSDQNLQVDGKVEGAIEMHGHKLTIGPRGEVRAEIEAQSVSIVGTVEGTIDASDRVELCSQSRVVGEIKARCIAIKDGAYFKGNIEVIESKSVVSIRQPEAEVA